MRREHVLNLDRIQPGDPGFFNYENEVQPGFPDERAELIRSTLPQC